MKEVEKLADESIYLEMRDIIRIGNQAVAKAKLENKKLGIPEVFSKNGVLYYVLENGEITKERPAILCD
jgi:ABC-type phosphate transport system auxiliary subunit